jgi:hypothetical protein
MIAVKRLFRITWRIMSYASAILLIATIALWVRSYWRDDELVVLHPFKAPPGKLYSIRLESETGTIIVVRATNDTAMEEGWPVRLYVLPRPGPQTFGELWGDWYHGGSPDYLAMIRFPHWVAVLLFSVLPATRLTGFALGRKRFSAGHCRSCGYDLRATPDRCPECGATPLK